LLDFEILKSFPETVSEAFDQFIGQHNNLSSRQLEFLNLLKGFIIDREKVEKKDLINAPFAVLHPQGIRGVFSPSEISEILQLTERLAGCWIEPRKARMTRNEEGMLSWTNQP
jgi:type I restriction enzyme R subunit